jgi:hypothetical protein
VHGAVVQGVRPFVELAPATAVVCSLDFEDSLEDASFTAYPRTASLRFEPASAAVVGKAGVGSASSRFSITPTDNPIKPWYLSTIPASVGSRSVVPTSGSPSLVGASPLSARSFSFASPAALRSAPPATPPFQRGGGAPLTPSSVNKQGQKNPPPAKPQQFPRTPRPSFLQSPSTLFAFRKDGQASRGERERESFLPFLRFYRRPYDEISYRAKMRPPLGGLISIAGEKFKQKPVQQPSVRRHAGLHHQQYHYHHHNQPQRF